MSLAKLGAYLAFESADASADLLGMMLESQEKGLFYVRIGDGAIELLQGHAGQTCDGESYHHGLAVAVADSIGALKQAPAVFWGDWRGAVGGSRPKYCAQWEALVDVNKRMLLHYEALLLMRESRRLVEFYKRARNDKRRKVWVGLGSNSAGAMKMLDCGAAVSLGMGGQFEYIDGIVEQLERLRPEVIHFGGGMAGLVAVVRYWREHPDTACIHLGSALDPLFTGASRGGQLRKGQLLTMFGEFL